MGYPLQKQALYRVLSAFVLSGLLVIAAAFWIRTDESLSLREVVLTVLAALLALAAILGSVLGLWIHDMVRTIIRMRDRAELFASEWTSPRSSLVAGGAGMRNELKSIDAWLSAMMDAMRDKAKELLLFRSLVDQSSDAFYIIDTESARILDVNARSCDMLGYTREELLGMRIPDINAEVTDEAAWKAVLVSLQHTGSRIWESRHRRKDGTTFPVELSVRRHTYADRSFNIAVARDITGRKQIELDLRIKNNAIETSINGIAISDMNGILTYVNRAYVETLGYDDAAAILGRPITDFSGSAGMVEQILSTLKAKGGWIGEIAGRRKDGTEVPRLMSASIVTEPDGTPISMLASFLDISEQKRADAELKRAKEFSEQLIRSAGVIVVVLDRQGAVLQLNKAGESITGYRQEDVAGRSWFEVIVPRERYPGVWEEFLRLRDQKTPANTFTNPVLTRSGEERIITWQNSILGEGDSLVTVSFGVDITEQRQAETRLRESEERLQRAQEVALIGSWELDLVNNKLIWSDQIYRIFELDQKRFEPSYESFLNIIHPNDRDLVNTTYQASVRDRTPYNISHRLLMTGGRIKHVREIGETIYDPGGRPVKSFGTVQDITAQKIAEEQLSSSLREKETLLREIHHRVKNNLQVISSLLYFQAKKMKDQEGLTALKEGQDRLRSMILVHEKLYRSRDLANVDFGDYVRTLADQMLQSYAAISGRVSVKVDVEQVFLPIEIALPCGMILNELVTNVFKYAFPGDRIGQTLIRTRLQAGSLTLVVRDTGAGIPREVNTAAPETFGLQLIRNLAQQLGGSVTFDQADGTTVTVEVPVSRDDRGDR